MHDTLAPQDEDGHALGDLLVLPTAGKADTDGTPSHCGRPMEQRRLDFTAVHAASNHVIAQAALEGRRVLACACGFLLEVPVAGEAVLVPEGADPALFASFFGRRLLAAAGHAESAEWNLDHGRDGRAVSERGPVDDVLVANLEEATRGLEAELLLALANGVPVAALAREAGIEETEIRTLLERHGVTGIAVADEVAVASAAAILPAAGHAVPA